VLGAALLVVVGALVLDMSASAPRTAGSDHTATPVFSATIPAGGRLCQGHVSLPDDAARVQFLIGTYGHPVPALRLSFIDAGGNPVAEGHLSAGAREGVLTIPIDHVRRAPATAACLRVGGAYNVVLGGENGPVTPGSAVVDGNPQPGRIGLLYFRSGSESWWQLLPELSRRFGLGKASFFGDWTLLLATVLLLAVWVGAVRLLVRELT
jgi:hypothetical protein